MKLYRDANAHFVILLEHLKEEVAGKARVALFCLALTGYRKTAKGHNGLQAKKSILYQPC